MSADANVIDYCRHRERYMEMHKATADERTETADAIRTVGGLLTETMLRNNVRCVRVVGNDTGVNYIRVVPERRRAKTLKNVTDVMTLLNGIEADVTDVPLEQLANAVSHAVQQRAREQGGTVPPRVQVTDRVGIRERVTEVDHLPRDVGELSKQMNTTHAERKELRKRLNPVKAEMVRSEQRVTQSAIQDPVVVQMRSVDERAPARVVRVCTQQYVKKRNIFGLRSVCGYVRDALARVKTREHLEDNLKREVRRIIEELERRPPEHGTKVTVRRGGGGAASVTPPSA